jgi:hypothetical protein
MSEKEIVSKIFKDYKSKFNESTDHLNFKEKDISLHSWLFEVIEKNSKEIISDINSLKEKPNFINAELSNWIETLEIEINLKSASKDKIKKQLVPYLIEFVQDLKECQLKIVDDAGLFTINRRLPKIDDNNKSKLSRKETLLLMIALRNDRIFNSNISNGLLSDCMGALVGFSGKKLEDDIQELQNNRISISEEDLSKLKQIILDVHDNIEEHLSKFK